MSTVDLIEQLRQALREEDAGGDVDATDAAIAAIAARLEDLDPPAKPVRVTGPAIPSGLTAAEISELAPELEEEISLCCPWEGCASEEFHEAWRLWSLARADLGLGATGVVATAYYASSRVEWDSAHDERLECVLCCRPVSVERIEDGDSFLVGPSVV